MGRNPTLSPVIIQPHAPHGLEAHERAEQGTDQRDQRVENGDGAGDDVCDYRDAEGAAEPGAPVYRRVAGQVSGALEDVDEDVFCR